MSKTNAEKTIANSKKEQVEAITLPFLEAKGAMGLVAGVSCDGQETAHCMGRLDGDGPLVPNERTLFEIGSITKVFTTTLLADMHLRGEVNLDDPVSRFLPPALVLQDRDGTAVTLRHLATHRSGLPRLPGNMGVEKLTSENPYRDYTIDDLYAYLSKCRLISSPGAFFGYSNLGMGLLGHTLALAAGMDFESLVIERVCAPLGMNDTVITLSEDQRSRLAPGHARGKQVSNWDLPALAGCGAFRSTLADMKNFLKANMHPEDTPLQDAILLAQSTQPRGWKGRRKVPWRAAVPGTLGVWIYSFLVLIGGLLVAQGQVGVPIVLAILVAASLATSLLFKFLPMPDMGLGWFAAPFGQNKNNRDRVFWHNGGTGGYRSYLGFVEGREVGVVLLSNATKSPDAVGQRLIDRLLTDADENE